MVNSYGIEHAEGFMHTFEGWVIFGACIVILFITAILLQRLTPNPKPLSETIDLDTQGLMAEARRIGGLVPARGITVATLLTAAITAAFLFVPRPVPEPVSRDSFALFPKEIGDWRGTTTELDPEIAAVLNASDSIDITFQNAAEAQPVNFFSAFYERQTEGTGIHSPEVCLPVGGWEIFSLGPHTVTVPDTVYGTFTLNRAVIQKGLSKQLVFYWFEQRGTRMTNDFAVKLSVLRDGLTRGRSDGALVRFVTPIGEEETEAAAEERILRMMGEVLPRLPAFVPE
jgi:exosortase D (VPLPA-CTERM-specific)